MAKGSYNISVPDDSNLKKEGKNVEIKECMKSCLSPAFLRSLSLHDRPRSSRVPSNTELRKSRYKALVSTSLEKIPFNPSPPSEARSECSTRHGFESARMNAETEVPIYSSLSSSPHRQTDQNQLSNPDDLFEDKYTRVSVECTELLEKTISILRTVDKDISESLADLTKPGSIALEPVIETYRNKGKSSTSCSAGTGFDLPTETSSQPIYENWLPSIPQRPMDAQAHTTPGRQKNFLVQCPRQSPKNIQVKSTRQSPKNVQGQSNHQSPENISSGCSAGSEFDLSTESSSQAIYENWEPFIPQKPKDPLAHSTPGRPKNLQAQSTGQSPKNKQVRSNRQSPKNLKAQLSQQSPKNAETYSTQQQSLKNLYPQSSQQSPSKDLLVHSAKETVNNSASILSSNSESTQSLTKSDSNDVGSVEQSAKNLLSSPTKSVSHDTSKVNSAGFSASSEFDLLTESSSEPIYENWQPSIPQRPKHAQVHSTPGRAKNLQAQFPRQSPKSILVHSTRQSPKSMLAQSSQQSPKTQTSQQSSPKNLLVNSAKETVNYFASNSGNSQSLTKLHSDVVGSVEQTQRNSLSLPTTSVPDDTIKVNPLIEFDLPSDHEQFIKIMGALQNRCLEYREMIQDVAVSALEECLNFSELSIGRIQHLCRQFASQKSNFRDFKELCYESVVFGPDSLPIDEKVTEVIQSFYLKLLQEENETFMVRLEFGLKMGEMYAKMLQLETESKKISTTLKREILYLKKTSVGFKV